MTDRITENDKLICSMEIIGNLNDDLISFAAKINCYY